MKRRIAVLMALIILSAVTYSQDQSTLETQKQKVSYIFGYLSGTDLSRFLKQQYMDLDTTIFFMGLRQGLEGQPSPFADTTMRRMYQEFMEEQNVKKMMIAKALADKNKRIADSVLAQNSIKDSVVALPSGLQYKIIRDGAGPSPALDDTVLCHYRGYLINGAEFDNSYSRGEPTQFPVRGVIKGWTEALQLMKIGSKWQLWIPPALGYGDRGAGGMIEPNALLQFEVELLDVKKFVPPPPKPEAKATPKKDVKKKK